jgi:PTS system nitrogen regulatory IIA component
MTVEDVAKLLRVSERTVYDWAQKGEIPGGMFGTSWRFKRSEVTKWIDRRVKSSKKSTSALPLPLSSVLDLKRIVFLDEDLKESVLARLADVLSEAPQIHNRAELLSQIFRREELMSTGIGLGIGVPHVRLNSVDDIVMAVGVCREPVVDYDSLDGEPVRFVCMIAARADQHAKHIKLLSALSQCWRNESVREDIYAAETPEQVFAALAGQE